MRRGEFHITLLWFIPVGHTIPESSKRDWQTTTQAPSEHYTAASA